MRAIKRFGNQCLAFAKTSKSGYVLVLLYFIVCLGLVGSYGVSVDEGIEREMSFVNAKYILQFFGIRMDAFPEGIKQSFLSVPELLTYKNRYYGAALQLPMVFGEAVISLIKGSALSRSSMFVMRHCINLLYYSTGALFFFKILWNRYKKTIFPLTGLLMFLLYPRFFGEAFFNIKDLLFLAGYTVTVYFSLAFLEHHRKVDALLFGISAAVCTNTRIFGISLLFLLIAFEVFARVFGYSRISIQSKKRQKGNMIPFMKRQSSLILCIVSFVVAYIIITPYTWSNPFRAFYETFFHFMNFTPWNGHQLYLGEMITSVTPWHFLPVWLGATLPPLYVIFFAIGAVCITTSAIKKLPTILRDAKAHKGILPTNNMRYDIFVLLCFVCSLLGFILLRIRVYTGWRHIYFVFAPLMYLAVAGLQKVWRYISGRHTLRIILGGIVCINLLALGVWIGKNNPFQYTYFSPIARPFVENNFEIDLLRAGAKPFYEYILEQDTRPEIRITTEFPYGANNGLAKADYSRVFNVTLEDSPDYIIQSSNGLPELRWQHEGYTEIYAQYVDGIKVGAVFESQKKDNAVKGTSIATCRGTLIHTSEDIQKMFDGTLETATSTQISQIPGDYLEIEFAQPVDYSAFRMLTGRTPYEFIKEAQVSVSNDGELWTAIEPIWHDHVRFVLPDITYRFLRIENAQDDYFPWTIAELVFEP